MQFIEQKHLDVVPLGSETAQRTGFTCSARASSLQEYVASRYFLVVECVAEVIVSHPIKQHTAFFVVSGDIIWCSGSYMLHGCLCSICLDLTSKSVLVSPS